MVPPILTSGTMVNELMREHRAVAPTKTERKLGLEEVIVSKTDPKGLITYANSVFCRMAGFTIPELIGAPHNLIRHPDMPRCVFKFLWDRISTGHEVFAYVKNMARNGDYYWVLAHVTPTYGKGGEIVGYHSNRRCPDASALATIEPIYASLRQIEMENTDPRAGIEMSMNALVTLLQTNKVSYDEFVFSLIR